MSDTPLVEQAYEHHRAGRYADAEAIYRSVLQNDSRHRLARYNLALLLIRSGQYDEAIDLLGGLLEDLPSPLQIHNQLGIAYTAANRLSQALPHMQKVLAIQPDHIQALHYVGNIQQALGQSQEAEQCFRRLLEAGEVIRVPAAQSPAEFRALLLFGPGGGNTPFEYMMKQVACSSTIMYLLPDFEYPLEMLRAEADVVVNLIADADKGRPMLEAACTLVEQLGMPVVNPPQKILPTDRESIAQLLSGIAGCLVPVTSHFPPAMLLSGDFDLKDSPFSYPVLLRPAGTHGGEDFEKVNDKDELQAQARKHPDALHYLSNYIDYRSADGYFRKYRFMFVGGEVYPYHLAIDSKWKIHHATTDMLNQQWMQDEEAAYLEDPHAVFGEAQYRVLHAIRDAVGLDYFGIDCGLDQQGRVVVFEVNACMLVHAHNENFPYKTPAVERIKAAFYQMLKGKALSGG